MPVKIDFVDFWNGFDKKNNFFWSILNEFFDVEISDDPDIIIYSCFGLSHYKYKCFKIFYSAENVRPDFSRADYAITFDYTEHIRHYRLPLYVLYYNMHKDNQLVQNPSLSKSKFCNFIYSNPTCKTRNRFFKLLSEYKRVDSGGRHLNNLGYPIPDKMKFINDYRFTIAFENSSFPGYTTEKIIEPFMVKSIPVYWGSPYVKKEFNTNAFINVHDFSSLEAAVERVKEVEENEELYKKYLNADMFIGDSFPSYFDRAALARFFERIFNEIKKGKPVCHNSLYLVKELEDEISTRAFGLKNHIKYYSKRVRQIFHKV